MRTIIFLILISLAISTVYIINMDGNIYIGWQRSGVYLVKGGYRAWWINYSYGQQFRPDGSLRNLWCKPYFSHVDVRTLINNNP